MAFRVVNLCRNDVTTLFYLLPARDEALWKRRDATPIVRQDATQQQTPTTRAQGSTQIEKDENQLVPPRVTLVSNTVISAHRAQRDGASSSSKCFSVYFVEVFHCPHFSSDMPTD